MPRLSEKQRDEVLRRYAKGEGGVSLGREFGCSANAVNALARRHGIPKRESSDLWRTASGHSLVDAAFEDITEKSAYWLGMLFADGALTQNNSVALTLKREDLPHLYAFRDFMGGSQKIIFPTASSARYAFRSKRVREQLACYGLLGKHQHAEKAAQKLAENRDFWRGVVDGDGYVSLAKRSGRNTHHARLELVGWQGLVEQFWCFSKPISGGSSVLVRRHKSIFRVAYSGVAAERLIMALYEGSAVALPRKSNAARNILARGLDTLGPDLKRTQERCKTTGKPVAAALTA